MSTLSTSLDQWQSKNNKEKYNNSLHHLPLKKKVDPTLKTKKKGKEKKTIKMKQKLALGLNISNW